MHADGKRGHRTAVFQEVLLKVFAAAPAQQTGSQSLMQTAQEGVDDAAAEPDKSWQQGRLNRRELGPAWHNSPDFFLCYSLEHGR